MNRVGKAALLAILLISAAGRIAALDPAQRISEYGHTTWRIQDGFFGGTLSSITQTTDGYLRIGTSAGVFRFDGVQFVPWTSLTGEPLPSNDVRALLGAKDGSLWIATGSGLLRWANHRSTHYLNGSASINCEHRNAMYGTLFVIPMVTWAMRQAVIDDRIVAVELHLLRLCPLDWIPENGTSLFEKMPTFFGVVNLEIGLSGGGKTLEVKFSAEWRNKPAQIVLHCPP